jgi:hypothetical protein
MLVPGLIPDHALILLTGKPKMGKSLMALAIGDALARGEAVFGAYPAQRSGSVAYVGMEDGRYEIANRLLSRHIARNDDALPLYICADRLPLGTPEGIALLVAMLEALDPAPILVIVDTAREALGVRDWNDPAEVAEKLRPLREQVARRICSVLLVAHNRKASGEDGDEIGGTNALSSSVDGWISDQRVERLESGNRRHTLSVRGRGAMDGQLAVEMDTRTYAFFDISADRQRAASATRASSRRARYAEVLGALVGLRGGSGTVAEVWAELPDSSESAVRRLLADAAMEGLAVASETPRAGAGRPRQTYALTQTGRALLRDAPGEEMTDL